MGNVVVMVSAADYQVRKDEAEASNCWVCSAFGWIWYGVVTVGCLGLIFSGFYGWMYLHMIC